MEDIIGRLRAAGLNGRDDRPHLASRPRASVLVPLFSKDSAAHALLTQRPTTLSSHPGEVCFPGGRQDPEDGGDDVVTALREAREEVGIDPGRVDALCRLRSVESRNGLCVTPVVGWVRQPPPLSPADLSLSEDEVEAAFAVPLPYFLDESNCVDKREIEWSGETFTMRTFMFRDDASGRTFKIWGLTAAVAYEVARIALLDRNSPKGSGAPGKDGADEGMNGHLFRWESGGASTRAFWARRFYVLGGSGRMLHQFDSEEQASRKSSSATKKNRLTLVDCDVSVPARCDESDRHEFVVSVLHGRLTWRLAAQNSEERDKWIAALQRASSPPSL